MVLPSESQNTEDCTGPGVSGSGCPTATQPLHLSPCTPRDHFLCPLEGFSSPHLPFQLWSSFLWESSGLRKKEEEPSLLPPFSLHQAFSRVGETLLPWEKKWILGRERFFKSYFFLYKAKVCVQYINRYTVYLWYLKYCVIKEKMSKRLLRGR